jgi:hypothetical protein
MSVHANAQAQNGLWPTALQLSKSGANGQALPLLEKLVSAYPKNKEYRFQLAITLFRMERDLRAKYHFEQVLGTDLTPSERDLVNRLIKTIDARKTWSGYLSFSIQPESNGTKQTDGRLIVVGGIPLTLDDTAIGKPTVSALINMGGVYSPTIKPDWKAQFALNAQIKHSNEVALRDYQLIGKAGLSFSPNALKTWSGGLSLSTRHSGGAAYSETVGLYASHARRIGKADTLQFSTEVSRAFRRNGRADIDRVYASFAYGRAINGNASVFASTFVELNNTAQLSSDGTRLGLSIGGTYAFKGGLSASLVLHGQTDKRTGVSQLFGVARSDSKLAVDLSIHHRDFRIGSFAPQIKFGFERNQSNIPLADYVNQTVSVGFTRSF